MRQSKLDRLNSNTRDYRASFQNMQLPSKSWNPLPEGQKILEKMKNAEGGAWDQAIAATRMGITIQTLHQRAKKRRVVAWTDANGVHHFPCWQFLETGLLPGVLECLDELRDSDQWAVMRFFLSEAESAANITPLTLLRQGNIGLALQVARAQSIRA